MIHVTGANGFIGTALCRELQKRGLAFSSSARSTSNWNSFALGDINAGTNWTQALQDVEVVIHLAARAHILKESASDALSEFRKVNRDACLNLARQAATCGVRRFVFVSSIGVNGETTDQPFSEDDQAAPLSDYAIAKWEAEQGLTEIAIQTGLELVIVRPPLVYGPHCKGNFEKLLAVIKRNFPLPLASIKNKRSYIGLENLVDFLILVAGAEKAANQTFVISDGEDLSTPQLIRILAEGMNYNSRLFAFPEILLHTVLRLLKREKMYRQLCGSLQVNSAKAKNLLGWQAPVSVEKGLRQTAFAYAQGE